MARVLLDLNASSFQEAWFALGKEEGHAVVATLAKIRKMEWPQLYQDRGLRWEAILSYAGRQGQRLYSLRITKRMRAVACREGDFLRFVSLHADHDSAYEK